MWENDPPQSTSKLAEKTKKELKNCTNHLIFQQEFPVIPRCE